MRVRHGKVEAITRIQYDSIRAHSRQFTAVAALAIALFGITAGGIPAAAVANCVAGGNLAGGGSASMGCAMSSGDAGATRQRSCSR